MEEIQKLKDKKEIKAKDKIMKLLAQKIKSFHKIRDLKQQL